jgi:hypothetical protein
MVNCIENVLIVDAVLLQQGHSALVSRGRQFSRSSGRRGIAKLGKSIAAPLNKFSQESIVRYLVSLPLNAVPVLGTFLFLMYNGEQKERAKLCVI